MIVGLLVVLGSVVAGYLMGGGALLVLNQPAEFIIIVIQRRGSPSTSRS